METAEAFQILGLSPSATEQEIEARFRSLAQERHPDQGGSKQAMQQLNHAREVALAAAALSRALVPADVVRDLVVATTTALAARSSVVHDLQTVSAQIRQTLTNRLRAFRQLSTLVGGISAGAFFFGKDLPDTYFKTVWKSSPQMPAMLQFMALTIGMYCAVIYWYLTNRIERAERLTEQLGAHLSVRPYYVSIVEEITHGADDWTFRDLEHYVTDWALSSTRKQSRWVALARDAGSEDFARLLIAKGRELGLLRSIEYAEGRSLVEMYSLSVSDWKR